MPGDVARRDFVAEVRRRAEVAACIASIWTVISGLATILNAHGLGIDPERLVEPTTGG